VRFQKFIAIPKSVSQARIQANAQIFDFELDAGDMEKVGLSSVY
jgi:diketogulonate reductase-like aldo/keto reductase